MTVMPNKPIKRKVVVIEEDESESDVNESSGEEASEEEIDDEENAEETSSDDEAESSDDETTITKKTPPPQNTEDDIDADLDDDGDDNSDVEGDDDNDTNANAAWADAIGKILKTNKPKKKKTLVLSKAKKLTDVKKDKPKPAGYQVLTESGEVKDEEVAEQDAVEEKTEEPLRKKKKDIISLRVKPNILERDRERRLAKVATKGVVQLFNAVRGQQKDITTKLDEAGPLDVKKDKAMKSIDKRSFLDVLMGEKTDVEEVKKEKSTWNVLRDDFMMGAKMKDWDKELEEEAEMEVENE